MEYKLDKKLADEILNYAQQVVMLSYKLLQKTYRGDPYRVYKDDYIVIEEETATRFPRIRVLKATGWDEREVGEVGRSNVLLDAVSRTIAEFHPGPWCEYLKNKYKEIMDKIPMEVEEESEDTRWNPIDY